jgi:glycosidase
MHSTESFYKGNINIGSLYDVLAKYQTTFPETAHRMYFTSNHDENTWNGTSGEKYGDMLKALSVFNCTWNGIPMIYSGEEMNNSKRLQFFEKDAIAWTGEYQLHNFYKTLLTLRKNNSALRSADAAVTTFHIITEGGKNIMAYLRKNDFYEVLVFLNFSKEATGFAIKDQLINNIYTNVFDTSESCLQPDTFIKMQPWDYLVFERNKYGN